MDRAGYARWLTVQLDAVYEKREPSPILSRLREPHRGWESHLKMLGKGGAYDQFVPEEKKPEFREALGDVLRAFVARDEATPHRNDAITDSMHLISALGAKESIPALVDATGSTTIADYDIFGTLLSFKPTPEVNETTRTILGHPKFNEEYL